MEEQNNLNLELQEDNQQKPEEKGTPAKTTMKKPPLKIIVGAIVLSVVAIIVILILALGGNKGANLTCDECGEKNPTESKFCSNCGNAFDNDESNGNQNNSGTNKNESIKSISTAKELFNNIKSNTTLSLTSSAFNINNSVTTTNTCVKSGEFDLFIISDIENLTLDGNASFVFEADWSYMCGLQFKNCKDIVFKNIKFTSSLENNTGLFTAISFADCSNIKFENCSFENLSSDISLSRTNKFDFKNCSFANVEYTSIYLWYSEDVTVDSCNFKNSGDAFYSTSSKVTVKDSTFEDINGSSIFCDELFDYTTETLTNESEATFEACTFKNNGLSNFFNKASHNGDYNYTYEYTHDKIKFKNCSFTNNVYLNGSLNTSNYLNCTITNNRLGVEVLDFTDWEFESALEYLNGINYTIEYSYADVEADCKSSAAVIFSQSDYGIVDATKTLTLYASKPAVTIEQIDWDTNSANGVEPDIKYTNHSDKQIAYIYFTVKFYDRVGYPAYCSIKDTAQQRLKVTGPINSGVTKTAYWDPVIYNSAVGAVKPLSIEVVFTDGTRQTITCTGRYWYSNGYYGGELND